MLSTFLAIAWDQMQTVSEQKARSEAQAAVDKIASAAKELYHQGEGARRMLTIIFPEGIDDGSPVIANNAIALKYRGSDIFAILDFPIYGKLPEKSGVYEIELTFQAGAIRIGRPPFTVTPASLRFITCVSNETQGLAQNLTFKNNQNETINITLSAIWSAAGVNVTLSNTSFALAIDESANVTVNVTLGPNVLGTFSGKIVASTTNYSMDILIAVVSQTCVIPPISYLVINTYKDSGYSVLSDSFALPPNVTITTENWPAFSWITIKIFSPTNELVFEDTAQVNSTGGYSFIWPAVGPLGNYRVDVNDSTTLVNTTFSLVNCP